MTKADVKQLMLDAFTAWDLAVRLTESTRGQWTWSAEDAESLMDWVADQIADEDEEDVRE